MNRPGFLFLAVSALCAALSAAIGFGSFVYRSQTSHGQIPLSPHLLLSGALFLALIGVLLFVSGLLALRHRRISDTARVIWVLVMLFFPVVGALVFFLVSPIRHERQIA